MQNYAIGLSGLAAAQAAMDVVGNNIANATTDGYHRQRVELAPSATGEIANVSIGAGVDIAGVTRMIDTLLEGEILRQQSASGQASQELSVLSSIETRLGEFGETGGLNATIDAFFTALQSLSAHPLEQIYRTEVVNSAETLTNEFRQLGDLLTDIQDQLTLEVQNTITSINALTTEIAALNGKIQSIEVSGEQASNLRDARDRLISQLADLTGVETLAREYGVVDVTIGGLCAVTGAVSTALEAGQREDQMLGVSLAGTEDYGLMPEGGRLGALLSLKNEQIVELQTRLDALAKAIINQVNQCHVQGVGQDGSFNQLTGWVMDEADLASAPAPITDGAFYLRVTNTNTGEVQRYAIDVTVSGGSPDTMTSIADRIDDLAGLNASVISSQLHIVADTGYSFDFLPALLPEPTAVDFTADVPPSVVVSGAYDGEQNQVFSFEVTGTGSVGNGVLGLTVTDADGNVVTSLSIGQGYAAGDVIKLNNGIKIAVSTGEVNDGDHFEVTALATTDTSGFLAAAGMNTFFSGSSASEMRVCSEITDSPNRIATALGSDMTDNRGVLRLAGIRDQGVESLDAMTPGEYYQRIAANLGQDIALKSARQDNVEAMIQNLEKRRSDISSVNVNDEAAQLMMYEKMFQAMAKYLASVQTTMTTLMDMV